MTTTLEARRKEDVRQVVLDTEDLPRIEGWTLKLVQTVRGKFYVGMSKNEGPVYMSAFLHRFLMDCPNGSGLEVDHKDGDPMNNVKANLRICTRAQNLQNAVMYKHKYHTQFKGVRWYVTRKSWYVAIQYKGIRLHLGEYHDEEEAGIAYDTAARKVGREFARLNFPGDKRRIFYAPNNTKGALRKDSRNALRAELYALPDPPND